MSPSAHPRALLVALLGVLLALGAGAAPAGAARRAVPQGFYGAVWDGTPAQAPADAQDAEWGRMASTGVESVRTVFSWTDAQPSGPGSTDFTATDALVGRAARHGLRLLPIVIYTPPWARSYPEAFNSPPARAEDYAAYLGALAARYGAGGSFWAEHPELPARPVREWQVWNEPHVRFFWNYPGPERPTAWVKPYGALVRAAHRALRSADPGAKLVLAGLTNDSWNHLERLLRAGRVRGSFEVAALQTYTDSPEHLLVAARRLRAVLRRHGSKAPIWLTEMGWPAARGRTTVPSYQRSIVTTDGGMAARLTRSYALLARHRRDGDLGVARAYWYTWASSYGADGNDGIFRWAGLSSYTDGAFTRRRAESAYRASARRDEGCAKTETAVCR